MESAQQRANCICWRAHQRAADLHHGPGRLKHTAPYRQRLCSLAVVGTQWRIAYVQLESQIRAGRPRRPGYLRIRDCEHALAADYARVGQQRLSVVGAGWTAHCISEDGGQASTDLDDAGRWHASAAIDARWRQLNAELELEVSSGMVARKVRVVTLVNRDAGCPCLIGL